MTCLVTGGAGFIGSHVVDELIRKRKKVLVLDDLSGGFRNNVHPGATFIKGSITDHRLVDRIFRKHRISHVFHLAAYAAENLSHFIRRFNYENNLIGSVNLINNAVNHDVKCFVFTSSIAVYGELKPPFSEKHEPEPADPYGIAKLAVERDLESARRLFGLNYVVFRAHNVYGERQNIGDRYRNVVGIFMNQILSGKPMSIFGDGKQMRAFTYIKDISPVIAKSAFAARCYNQVFNLGAEKPHAVSEVAELCARAFGVTPEIERHPARAEVKYAWSTHGKTRRYFGKRKETSLDEGIRRMARWVRLTGAKSSKAFGKIEIPRKMPW